MKTMKKLLCVFLSVVTICLCFAACSKNEAKVKIIDIELSAEEYAFGVDKDQPELLKDANAFIAEIKENGKLEEICNKYFGDGTPTPVTSAKEDSTKEQLIVATNAEFKPFEYTEGDKFYGIDMEIAQLLAEKLGRELVIKDMNFDAVLLSVEKKKCDIGMAGLTISEDRKKQVNFTNSYYSASQKLIVKADDTTFDNCTTKEDVDKILNALDASAKIGGQNGTTGQGYVEGSKDLGFDGLPATFQGYANGSLAVQDLINGSVQYVIIDAAPAQAIVTAINSVA